MAFERVEYGEPTSDRRRALCRADLAPYPRFTVGSTSSETKQILT